MTGNNPAYLIGNFSVTDPALMAEYGKQATPLARRYGGEVIVAASDLAPVEGHAEPVLVIIRFPSMVEAEAFYHSPEYTPMKALRIRATTGGFLALVPGRAPSL